MGPKEAYGQESRPIGLGGLIERVRDIVGANAGYAMFHVAAQEEGRRLAAPPAPRDAQDLLARIDRVLDQESELLDGAPGKVRIRARSPFLAGDDKVLAGIALGMLEGGFGALHGRRYEASLGAHDGDARLIRLEGDRHG